MKTIEIINKHIDFNDTINKKNNTTLWGKRILGFEIYELFWMFILFSILGFFIETVWCLIKNGYIESRKGLVLGPFCPIYGVGSVILIVSLLSFRHNTLKLSIGSLFYGSIVEYFFSFFQEHLFGTLSWDYSHMPFNINGRICLIYSLGWTILGVLIIKYVYPYVNILIYSLPREEGEQFATLILCYLALDVFLSVKAVIRADKRSSFIPAQNILDKYLDKNFDDTNMYKIFPNMSFDK